ncbi:MAG: sugar phosphate isomerase/epimerase [Verrucomicrobia bacterium]|nr:sugar phosphate isomerase/epimerase [Verrucomicrobiota bacterium]
MKPPVTRREFLTASAASLAGLALGAVGGPTVLRAAEPRYRTRLSKALTVNKPTEAQLQQLKEAGFDGVEAGIQSPPEAEKCRAAAERVGMKIHAVLRGWAEFNSPDAAKVEASFRVTQEALRAAAAYGADAVLLVPCRIGGMRVPRPWEFLIEFDERTGHVQQVVAGDNAPFREYIRAHNHAIDTSREAVQRLIPLAEECRVAIALENVWNNLWVTPPIFRQFVASFGSPWVQAYFDVGNHVKYAAPEQWILTLAGRLAKVHVKDFLLNRSDPNGEGKFVNIRDGSVRWPVVREALERVGYNGWMTIEGGDLSPQEHARRLDQIIAGQ